MPIHRSKEAWIWKWCLMVALPYNQTLLTVHQGHAKSKFFSSMQWKHQPCQVTCSVMVSKYYQMSQTYYTWNLTLFISNIDVGLSSMLPSAKFHHKWKDVRLFSNISPVNHLWLSLNFLFRVAFVCLNTEFIEMVRLYIFLYKRNISL